jgi:hypothetical protein
VQRLVEAFNSGDHEAIFALMTPGAVLRSDPDWPDGGEFRGPEEIGAFLDKFEDSWGRIVYETSGEPEAVGEALLLPSRWVARGKSSGIDTQMDFWGVFTFEGERLDRLDFFFSRDDAVDHARSLGATRE